MHCLWLFPSSNGLVCTHANERRGWRDRRGGRKEWWLAGWNGKHTRMRPEFVSHKTMLLEHHARSGHCCVYEVPPVCRFPPAASKVWQRGLRAIYDSARLGVCSLARLPKLHPVHAHFSIRDMWDRAGYRSEMLMWDHVSAAAPVLMMRFWILIRRHFKWASRIDCVPKCRYSKVTRGWQKVVNKSIGRKLAAMLKLNEQINW